MACPGKQRGLRRFLALAMLLAIAPFAAAAEAANGDHPPHDFNTLRDPTVPSSSFGLGCKYADTGGIQART
jgi:hypothetical protein